ncbi:MULTISPECIES: hypothetical protein [unclassified Paenibacillus]
MAGNSLGSIIMNYNLPEGHEEWSFQEANSYFFSKFYNDRPSAYESYETWLAWKAIMGVSEIMSTLYPDTPAPKEGIDWLNEESCARCGRNKPVEGYEWCSECRPDLEAKEGE